MKVQSDGFTLVELLISISITVIAGYLLVVILGQNNGIFLKQSSNISQGMSLNDAETVINEAIRQSSAVAGSSPTTPVYTTSINTLVLQVPSIDSSANIINGSFDFIVIAPDSTAPAILRYQVFPTSPSMRKSANRVLMTSLASIRYLFFNSAGQVVSPSSATQINYTINLSQKAGLVYQQSSGSAQVSLRNN